MMKNVIYQGVTRPASEAPDGETPSLVLVTEEVNGFAVWTSSHDEGVELVCFHHYPNADRSGAIENGVLLARKLRREHSEQQAEACAG